MKQNPANFKKIGAASVILLLALALIGLSFTIKSRTTTGLGPGFFPRLVGIGLAALAIADLIKAIKDYKFLAANGKLLPPGEKKSFKDLFYDNLDWVSGILIVVYVIAIYNFGFLLPSILYMFLQILLYTTTKKRHWVLYVILSIVIPCAIYFLFRNYFHLMLPKGILG